MTKEQLLERLSNHARMAIERLDADARITAVSVVPIETWGAVQKLDEMRRQLEDDLLAVRELLSKSPASNIAGRYSSDKDYILRHWTFGSSSTFREKVIVDIINRIQYTDEYRNAKKLIEEKFDVALVKIKRTQSIKKLQDMAIEMGMLAVGDAEEVKEDTGIDTQYIRTEVRKAQAQLTGGVE